MRGLVLSGGGAKGAYEVGVIKALDEVNFKPDIVTGTSIGAVNAALYIQGGYKLLNRFWKKLKIKDLVGEDFSTEIIEDPNKTRIELVKKVIKEFGISSKLFYDKLKRTLDEDKIRKSKIQFGLVTFNVTKMKVEMLYKEDIEEGKLVDYIVASCSCFPALKGARIEDSLYIDGAYGDNMPINMAIKKGATNIVAVNLKAIGVYSIPMSKKKNKEDVEVKYIAPDEYLGDLLYFDSDNIKKNILKGYIDACYKFEECFGKKIYITKPYANFLITKIKDDRISKDLLKKQKEFEFKILKNVLHEISENPEEFIMESLENIYFLIKFNSLKKEKKILKIYDRISLKKLLYFKFIISKSNNLNELFDMIAKGKKVTIDNVNDVLKDVDVSLIVRYILKLLDNIKREENKRRLNLICRFFKKELKTALFIKLIMEW